MYNYTVATVFSQLKRKVNFSLSNSFYDKYSVRRGKREYFSTPSSTFRALNKEKKKIYDRKTRTGTMIVDPRSFRPDERIKVVRISLTVTNERQT